MIQDEHQECSVRCFTWLEVALVLMRLMLASPTSAAHRPIPFKKIGCLIFPSLPQTLSNLDLARVSTGESAAVDAKMQQVPRQPDSSQRSSMRLGSTNPVLRTNAPEGPAARCPASTRTRSMAAVNAARQNLPARAPTGAILQAETTPASDFPEGQFHRDEYNFFVGRPEGPAGNT